MAPAGFKLGDDTVHVKGRSSAKAQELLTLAADKGIDPALIQTTSVGYLVPKALVEDVKLEGAEDQENQENQDAGEDTSTGTDQTPEGNTSEENGGEADGGDTPDANLEAYDPSKHTVDEVVEYLEGADEAERARVIAAEKESSKPRKGVLELADTGEETK
jgi:hypothetical protein